MNSIYGKINKLAIPIALTNALGLIAMLINIKILGSLSSHYFYLLSLYLPLNFWVISLFESLKVPSTALTASVYHDGDKQQIFPLLLFLFVITIIGLLIPALLLLCFPRLFTSLLSVASFSASSFIIFAVTMLFASILMACFFIACGVLNGTNKARLSLLISIFAVILSVLCNWFFCYHTQLGILSLPAATSISYGVVFSILLYFLFKTGICAFKNPMHILKKNHLQKLSQLAVPVWLTYGILALALLGFNAVLSQVSHDAISGFGIAYRIQTIVLLPAIAMGTAVAIFLNQIVGKGGNPYGEGYVLKGLISCILCYLPIVIGLTVASSFWVHLITNDSSIAHIAASYLTIVGPSYVGLGIVLFYTVILDQTGFGRRSFFLTGFILIAEVLLGYLAVATFHQASALYWVIFAFNLLSGGSVFLWLVKEQFFLSTKVAFI